MAGPNSTDDTRSSFGIGAEGDGEGTLAGTLAGEALPPKPVSNAPGQRIGRYLIVETIGKGSMGVVYAAYDPELDRKVALKVIRGRKGGPLSSGAADRLLSEAQTLARLSHPNVVAVHDAGATESEDREVYVAMEFVDGGTLSEWMTVQRRTEEWKRGAMTSTIVERFVEAGRGLLAAHDAEIVHGDFKPSNVLIGAAGHLRVADFGLARRVARSSSSSISSSDLSDSGELDTSGKLPRLAGTPRYMAPEQLHGEPATEHSDQYAFCTSLFEALTGERPFQASSLPELVGLKVKGDVAWPNDCPRVPRWLRDAVLKGLHRDPPRRHASMGALVELLDRDRWAGVRRVSGWGAVLGLCATLVYVGYEATRPGYVTVDVTSGEDPIRPRSVSVGGTPLEVRGGGAHGSIPAGTYTMRVEADGHLAYDTVVEVGRNSVAQLDVALKREQGELDVFVEPPGASVLIDGEDRGSRLAGLPIATGHHELQITKPGHFDMTAGVDITLGQRVSKFVYLPKALQWSTRATGVFSDLEWIGDATGDGRSELLQRNYMTIRVFDPWNDRLLWRRPLGRDERVRVGFADLDGDGVQEILSLFRFDSRAVLEVFDPRQESANAKPRWVQKFEGDEAVITARPIAADVDGDATGDVIAAVRGGVFLEARSGKDGRLRWASLVDSPVVSIAAHGDQIYALGLSHVSAHRASDGATVWSEANDLVASETGARALRLSAKFPLEWLRLEEMDRDTVADVVVASNIGMGGRSMSVSAFSGASGKELWTARGHFEQRPFDRTEDWEDFDADGVVDVLRVERWSSPDTVFDTAAVSGATGETIWRVPGVTCGILEVDGRRCLCTSDGANSEIHLLDPRTGAVHRTIRTRLPAQLAPVAGDIDGDGRREFLVPTREGLLMVGFGGVERGLIRLESRLRDIRPPVDHDGDGFVDVLAESNGAIVLRGPSLLWERVATDALRSTPVVGDLDGDGSPEVATIGDFGTGKRLTIIDAHTGAVEASGEPAQAIRDPAAVPNTRGGIDILFSTFSPNAVTLYSGRDASIVRSRPVATNWSGPAWGDVDADGTPEAIFTPWDRDDLLILSGDTFEVEARLPIAGGWVHPAILDLEGDGAPEIVTGFHDGSVAVLDGDAKIRWKVALGVDKQTHQPAVADWDGDGTLDVIASRTTPNEGLAVLRGSDGTEIGSIEGVGWPGVRLLTVDGEDGPEVLVRSDDLEFCRITKMGVARWCYGVPPNLDGAKTAPTGQPVIDDLDGDGRVEVLTTWSDGSLHVIDIEDGRRRWMFQGSQRYGFDAAPVPYDVDGDGLKEVFLAGYDRRLRCLRSPRSAQD